MGITRDFLVDVGIDPARLRFRQHEQDEMAHYAVDCWDAEMRAATGGLSASGLLTGVATTSRATKRQRAKRCARREFDEPRTITIDAWTINGATAGPAFKALAGAVKTAVEALPKSTTFPCEVALQDGTTVVVGEEHVKPNQKTIKETGEWYIPHVIEPAFGIDRIIWHVIDHAYAESEKNGEPYVDAPLTQHRTWTTPCSRC